MSSSIIAFSTLFGSAVEQDPDQEPPLGPQVVEGAGAEAAPTLIRLPPGPWRSLGRRLDYTNWTDRERFLELDRAIQTSSRLEQMSWRYCRHAQTISRDEHYRTLGLDSANSSEGRKECLTTQRI